MNKSTIATCISTLTLAAALLLFVLPEPGYTQRGRGRGGRGGPPPVAQQAAPIDLTGYWVSIINEDWRWRMMTPRPGDYSSVPLNDAGVEMTDSWDLDADARNGNECRPFGVGGIMRVPGRLNITWQDPETLRIDADAGTQTRVLHFGDVAPPEGRTLQGHSVATWEFVGGGRGQPPTGGTLNVVTTGMEMGYLRWNGVPYSEDAVVTEFFDRHGAFGQEWITVTTMVEDPTYLTQPFIVTSDFRKETDGSNWNPTACETVPPASE